MVVDTQIFSHIKVKINYIVQIIHIGRDAYGEINIDFFTYYTSYCRIHQYLVLIAFIKRVQIIKKNYHSMNC